MNIRALVLVFVIGCSYHLDDGYHVDIDPAFSAAQQDDILAALDDWQTMLGPENFSYQATIGSCSSSDGWVGERSHVCVKATTLSYVQFLGENQGTLGYTKRYDGLDNSNVFLPTDDIRANVLVEMKQIATHELGHAFGLAHTGPGTIMCGGTACAAPTVTCADVVQYVTLRHGFLPPCSYKVLKVITKQ